jgi:DNA replication protein DnaC
MLKSYEDYLSLVRSFNIKQTEFFYFVTDKIKNSPHEAFHVFLTGGAGVGKTAVTNAIYQMAIRYLNKEAGANPDDLKGLFYVERSNQGKVVFVFHHVWLDAFFICCIWNTKSNIQFNCFGRIVLWICM